ncbi:MAG: hypothetical protein ABR985_18300, partial [Methanotrichaceae archaeon]
MDEDSERDSKRKLLALSLEYYNELTENDKVFLDGMVTEVEKFDLNSSIDENAINKSNEINQEALNDGLDFILNTSGLSLPHTFENINRKELEFLSEQIFSLYKIPYISISETTIRALERESDDDLLSIMKDMTTGDYLIKEMVSDFGACLSLAILGFYKQAISTLRNMLESTVLLIYIEIAKKPSNWVNGSYGVDKIREMVNQLRDLGIIDDSLKNELMNLYWDYLSTATHSHKARMNAVRTDKHDFDLVRFNEFLGILSWYCMCCQKLIKPFIVSGDTILCNDKNTAIMDYWSNLEKSSKSSQISQISKRAELAKQD